MRKRDKIIIIIALLTAFGSLGFPGLIGMIMLFGLVYSIGTLLDKRRER